MALSETEKTAHETIVPLPQQPSHQGYSQTPSQIVHPGSPPPPFTNEAASPLTTGAYPAQPQMAYAQPPMGYAQQLPQMAQQPTYHQQSTLPQPPQQQPAFGPQGMQQPQAPQMMQPQRQQYHTAVAIPNLGMGAAPADCPMCGQRSLTNVSYHAGNTTHIWAGITFCLTGCLCFIPYMMNSLKDVQHRCGSCGSILATWHKSGQTEVHAHA